MSTFSYQEIEKIKEVFSAINDQKFSTMRGNVGLLKNLKHISKFLSKETYDSEDNLEKGISIFNPDLFQAWERLYLFKFLNEYDFTNSYPSVESFLFRMLTDCIVNGTDASESFRQDTLAYRNGKIIE